MKMVFKMAFDVILILLTFFSHQETWGNFLPSDSTFCLLGSSNDTVLSSSISYVDWGQNTLVNAAA